MSDNEKKTELRIVEMEDKEKTNKPDRLCCR